MRRQLLLKGGDDLACGGTGARVAARNEDYAVIAWAAGRDRLVMQGPHIYEVVGDDHSTLIACKVNDTAVIEGAPLGVLLDRLHIVATCAQLPRNRGRQHLIEQ